MIYLTSDLHFCHDKDFIYGARGFDSADDMNRAIIENWNSIINDDDEVYVLGDLMLKDNETGLQCWNELKGIKHVILGNHDSNARIELYKDCPNTDILGYAAPLRYKGYEFLLTHYPTLSANYDDDKDLKEKVINICGHVHTKDKFFDWDKGIIYHVELDAHDNKPITIDQVLSDIKAKLSL